MCDVLRLRERGGLLFERFIQLGKHVKIAINIRGIIIYQYPHKNFFARYLMTRLPYLKKWVEDAMV